MHSASRMGLLVWALLTPSSIVHAQTSETIMNGTMLAAACDKGAEECGAYLQGVADMMIVSRGQVCGVPRYNRPQLREAYRRWIRLNSYFLDVHMVAGVKKAIDDAWPCGGNGKERQ